jgi:hypothetical protein
MKKLLISLMVVLVILAGFGAAAWHYAPRLAFRLLGKAISGSVIADKTSVAYRDGALVFTLNGVRTSGVVEGTVGNCQVELLLRKGLYVRHLQVSDFDVTVRKEQGAVRFYPIPVERAEITKGVLNYDGRKYVIREIKASNFNTGKELEFSLDGGVEGLGNIKTHGFGIFGGEKRSEVRGEYSLSRVDMARVLKYYEGLADSRGTFSYRNGTFTMDGDMQAAYFSIWEKFFVRRLGQENPKGHIHLTKTGETIEVDLTRLKFRDSPLALRLTSRQKELLYLELTTGFMDIPEVLKYVNPAGFSEGEWDPFSYVKDGEVRIDKLVFRKETGVSAQLGIRGASAGRGDVDFRDVEGTLRLDGRAVVLSGFGGRLGQSRLEGVSGIVPLSPKADIDVHGSYAAEVGDIARFYDSAAIDLRSGIARGEFAFKGREETGFRVGGTGSLKDGHLAIRRIPVDVAGEYRFDNDAISFDWLSVTGSGNDLELAGKVGKASVAISGGGKVNAGNLVLASFVPPEYHPDGLIEVEGSVEAGADGITATGSVDMGDASFEVPGILKKPSGIESTAKLSISGRTDKEIRVDELSVTLGGMEAQATGRVYPDRIKDAHLIFDLPAIERASGLFFFDAFQARGDLKADLACEDLSLSMEQLPAVRGSLSFRNGGVHLPSMAEAITGIDLDCTFLGDSFTVNAAGLRAGNSVMRTARLSVTGVERPSFDLAVGMKQLDLNDLRGSAERAFHLPVIDEESLFARTSGVFSMRAESVSMGEITGNDALVDGQFDQGTFWVKAGAVKTEAGSIQVKGILALKPRPEVQVAVDMKDVDAGKMIALAGGKTDLIEGSGSVSADLHFSGTDGEELLRSATGRVRVQSRQGVIKKWNLMSKLFALMNVYDLFRGRVDLTKQGLSYRRLNATFQGEKGIFRTANFLIDSPSMIITGQGAIDAAGKTVDARMLVSPLVTLDRIMDRIPLIRSIFKERKTGFLFFLYDVKGPLDDPEVTSRYVQSMGKRVLNIFVNTILLPKEVLELLPKEEPGQ